MFDDVHQLVDNFVAQSHFITSNNKKGTERVHIVTVASIAQDAEAGQLTARDAAGAERLFFSRTPRTVRR